MSDDEKIAFVVLAFLLVIGGIIWVWVILPKKAKRSTGLIALCITLVVGACLNVETIHNPPLKLTAYWQEHASSYEVTPQTMQDVPATFAQLGAINLAILMTSLVFLTLGGITFSSKKTDAPQSMPQLVKNRDTEESNREAKEKSEEECPAGELVDGRDQPGHGQESGAGEENDAGSNTRAMPPERFREDYLRHDAKAYVLDRRRQRR